MFLPFWRIHLRHRWAFERLVRPVRLGEFIDLGNLRSLFLDMVKLIGVFRSPRKTHLDPLRQRRDLGILKFPAGWHFMLFILVRDHVKQKAVFWLRLIKGRTEGPSCSNAQSTNDLKFAANLDLAIPVHTTMTSHAIRLEDRSHFSGEERHLVLGEGWSGSETRNKCGYAE